jgi:hypothetical protein
MANIHFARVGYEQSQKDTSVSGNIPIGKIVIGGEYSQQTYNERKERILQTQTWDTNIVRNIDLMLATGDATIIDAWKTCMKTKSGLTLRFANVTAKSATAVVEWFGSAGVNEVAPTTNFVPPKGVTVKSGLECVDARSVVPADRKPIISNTDGCRVLFELDGPEVPLALSLNTTAGGSADAYLPPRVRLREDRRPYALCQKPGVCNLAVTALERTASSTERTFVSDYQNGWFFALSEQPPTTSILPHKGGNLQIAFASYRPVGSGQVQVYLGCSNSSKFDMQCVAYPRFEEVRYVWEYVKDEVQKPSVAAAAKAAATTAK